MKGDPSTNNCNMDLPNTLSAIKKHIGEGNIEQAFEQLVALLDSDPRYAELAQTARVNQGELYQVKAQILKNTITQEDAQLATNKLADNALQIIRRLETGKLGTAEAGPSHSKVWRYYVAGGVVALAAAFLIWQFWKKKEAGCPTYDDNVQYRVMILPFKQTGAMKDFEPEFEIVDDLGKLINKTPGLKAGADVNEGYKIEENYPSFAEAGVLANDCGVQMVVWGKIRKDSEADYKIDVFYKLLDEGVLRSSGDTTLSNLLETTKEGQQLTRDVAAVTNLLYIVLANRARVPVLASLLELPPPPAATAVKTTASDTSWMPMALALADNFKNNKQEDKAIETYDRVLESFPDNEEARQKRGALLYKKGDFAAAARDLDFVIPDDKAAGSDLLKIRVEANLKSGNPAKALENLQLLRQTEGENKWLKSKTQEVRDTMKSLQLKLDSIERQAQSKPEDSKTQISAAQTNAALGRHDKALNYANKALKINPKSEAAYEVKAETQLAKGDTSGAQKTIQEAEKKGVNTRTIDKLRFPVRQLKPSQEPQKKEGSK